jgi:quercetin dioxygenase-like cupin family protein
MTLNAYIAQAEEHQQLAWMGTSTLDVLVDSAVTNGQVLIMAAQSSRGSGVPVHVHRGEDEVFVLLEGSLIVWVGHERIELRAGGVAFLPRKVPHAYVVTSETARILEVITPGGLEEAFREAGWDMSEPRPADWSCTPAAVSQAMARAGCEILGRPMTEEDGPITDAPESR